MHIRQPRVKVQKPKNRQVQFLLGKISCVLFYVLFNGIEILFLLHLHSTILIIILHPFVVIGGVWTDSIQVRVTGHLGGDAERGNIQYYCWKQESRPKKKGTESSFQKSVNKESYGHTNWYIYLRYPLMFNVLFFNF